MPTPKPRPATKRAKAAAAIAEPSVFQPLESARKPAGHDASVDTESAQAAASLEPLEPFADVALPVPKPASVQAALAALPAAPAAPPARASAVDGSGAIDWSRFANSGAAAKVPAERVTRIPWVEHAEIGPYVASFDALPLETVDPGETLAPPDPSRSGIITSLTTRSTRWSQPFITSIASSPSPAESTS